MKLTKEQKKALLWMRDKEPVSKFPRDGVAPSIRLIKRLESIGLIERVGVENGPWGYTKFSTSEAGREALEEQG